MKWLFKWFLRLALVVIVLGVIAYFAKDPILRLVIEKRIRSETGMEAQIGKFSSGRNGAATYVTLENLKLYNTAEFGGGLFLDLPELHIECDPVALAQSKLHLTVARLNLAELAIVKNTAGKTNLLALQTFLTRGGATTNGAPIHFNGIEFQGIDVLVLSLGRARFVDLKDTRNNREIPVNLDKQAFTNVKSEADVYGIAIMLWLRSGGTLSLTPPPVPKSPLPPAPSR
jgi:hypothetical protein